MHGLSYASLLDSSSVRLDLSGLEVNVKGLQAELHEAKSRNIYLTGLLEEQKKYDRVKLRMLQEICIGVIQSSSHVTKCRCESPQAQKREAIIVGKSA